MAKKEITSEPELASVNDTDSAKDKSTIQDKKEPKVKQNFYGTNSGSPVGTNVEYSASLKELIEKNIKWSQVIYNQNKKIKRRLNWMVFGSYLRLFIILAPIILGIWFLPEIMSKFNEYFSIFLQAQGIDTTTISDVLKNFQGAGNVDQSQIQQYLNSAR